jgi:uncharacterized protein DUF4349
MRAVLIVVALVSGLAACGGSDSSSTSYPLGEETTSGGESESGGVDTGAGAANAASVPTAPMDAPPTTQNDVLRMEEPTAEARGAGVMESLFGGGEDRERALEEDHRVAQANVPRHAPPPTPPPPPTQPPQQQAEPQTTSDATSGPLLIYEAILNMAVYQVPDNQRAVISIAQELGGFLATQNDQAVTIRVPASKFHEALGRIEALGDVLHRNIQAQDVSQEFRDLQIRLRNSEAIRDRLATLLQQARNVEESLSIERELERVTTDIETMKGRIRFLEDRIGYSTITVNFQPQEQENLQGDIFHLPFDWLYNLGLRTLLNLR